MDLIQHQSPAVKPVYIFCMPGSLETDRLKLTQLCSQNSDEAKTEDQRDIADMGHNSKCLKQEVHVVPIAPKPIRKPFQKYCNMLHVCRSFTGKLTYYCLSVPIFCTVQNLNSLIPMEEDKPAYLLRDEMDRIRGIMADNLRPANYLIYRPPSLQGKKIEACMPNGSVTSDENLNAARWYIEQVELSPYLASPTDPFPGQHFIMLSVFSDTPPTTDISCLDLPEIVQEIEGSQENAESSYLQFGPECNHIYYFLMLSKVQNLHTDMAEKRRKLKLRLNFMDKNARKIKAAKAKKKKMKASTMASIEVFDEACTEMEQERK